MWEYVTTLIRALLNRHKEIAAAIDELNDLPQHVDGLKGIVMGLRSIPDELLNEFRKGGLTLNAAERVAGRLSDLGKSGEAILKDLIEAVEAVQKAYGSVRSDVSA